MVGNYNVFQNFYSSNFLCNGDNPDNIYLDHVDYISNERKESSIQEQEFPFLGAILL